MLRRKGGFSARIFVPVELQELVGRREVWRSTQTDDPREARLRESFWQHHFQTLFVRLAKAGRSMAQDQLSALVAEYLDARFEEIEERLAVDLPGLDGTSRDVWQDGIIEKLEAVERQLIKGDHSHTSAQAAQMLPGGSDVSIAVLARRLLEAQFDVLRAELHSLQGKPLRRARIVAKAAGDGAAKETSSAPKVSPRVSQVCSDFIETTGTAQRWSEKTLSARRQGANLLVDFLDDRSIAEVTRALMTEAYLLLPRVPTHYTKRYPRMTPRAAIEAADKNSDAERYSPKSCNLRLETWKAVFKYAQDHDTIEKSPADHLKAFAEGRAQDARDAFTDAQLRAFLSLLTGESGQRPEHYWVARMMAYTGLRLEEASALRPCDVREVDGVLCVEVAPDASNIKTENAARLVPVHSDLRSDLWAHVRAHKMEPKGNLWGLERDRSGKWSASLSKRLNKRLSAAVPGKSKKLVVESLRNTFATKLKAADVQEHVISELMGHAVDSLAVGRYGKKLEPAKLQAHVEKLSIPKV